ncbi:MAG: hypothetical protein WDM71_09030 [Ferruginibacter sp.]
MIFKSDDNDSTFIAADTLFSGVVKKDTIRIDTTFKTDTLIKTTIIKSLDTSISTTEKTRLDQKRKDPYKKYSH